MSVKFVLATICSLMFVISSLCGMYFTSASVVFVYLLDKDTVLFWYMILSIFTAISILIYLYRDSISVNQEVSEDVQYALTMVNLFIFTCIIRG